MAANFSLNWPLNSSVVNSGPVQFLLNGVATQVNEDTVTPSNNNPLPVKLTSVTGDINITAGDLNVQMSAFGPTFDSCRIGDGTNLLALTAAGEVNAIVTATNLDIRDLNSASDSVTVVATNLDIRDLDSASDSVTVVATNLDIRDLDSATDSVTVVATNLDIRDLAFASDSVDVSGSSVSITGTVTTTGGLTDAELRATPVPVSGTVTANAGTGTFAVSAAALPLPTGAATETTLAAIDTKLGAPLAVTGPLTDTELRATPVPVSGTVSTGGLTDTELRATPVAVSGTVTANAGTGTFAVSAAALPLPTGAATETTLAALDAKVVAVDTGAVTISSALPAGTNNIGDVDVATLPVSFNTGNADATTQRVVIATDQTPFAVTISGAVNQTYLAKARIDYSSSPVTTAAYTTLIASVGATAVKELEIFDSSGETLVIAIGAAASEVDQNYIMPGGNGRITLAIAAGVRVSVKAVTATASVGYLNVNFYG